MLYTSVNTDYNNDIQNWDEIEHQIKCLAETGFTHTSWMHNWVVNIFIVQVKCFMHGICCGITD